MKRQRLPAVQRRSPLHPVGRCIRWKPRDAAHRFNAHRDGVNGTAAPGLIIFCLDGGWWKAGIRLD